MSDTAAVRAEGLQKTFGSRPAVRGVDFTLHSGECLALFGPNGAGKTTLLRLVAGLLKPTAGAVVVHGVAARGDAGSRGVVGLISHHTMLYSALTGRENVQFSARLHGLGDAETKVALETLRVAEHADVPVRTLSRGLQQRVSIARAIVHKPAILLLDEPYSGLDELGASALTAALRNLIAGGATLVLVTHNITEGLTLATRAAVMNQGLIARDDLRPSAGFDVTRFAADYRALVGVNGG
jgi:heme exporter protein A